MRAFALKENRDLDCVGAIRINAAGESLNVREALQGARDGVYVTEHPDEIAALEAYEPIKGVQVPEPKPEKRPATGKPEGKE